MNHILETAGDFRLKIYIYDLFIEIYLYYNFGKNLKALPSSLSPL